MVSTIQSFKTADVEQFDQLGEIRQRPRQTVDLVDDDDVKLPGADIVQQPLQVGAVG